MGGRKVLRLVRGTLKNAYCKFYAEPELREFVQQYADENEITFSKAARQFIIAGLKNQGVDVKYVDAA